MFYLSLSTFYGRFNEIGAFVGISSLVLRDELPQSMTSWLLKGNQERFDPLKSRVYML
jgi:hypothetical protein